MACFYIEDVDDHVLVDLIKILVRNCQNRNGKNKQK